jgi:hypothetical protein
VPHEVPNPNLQRRSMKSFILVLALIITIGTNAFANEYYNESEEILSEEGILHEMFLACVSKKLECTRLAKREGFNISRSVKDAARCPSSLKSLACIVQH